MATQHCYTMELGRNRVWDYVGDNFVHRLMQTDSADGKLVESEAPADGRFSVGGGDSRVGSCERCGRRGYESGENPDNPAKGIGVDADEKLDSIQLEYTYLLTSQLEAQRRCEAVIRLWETTYR